MDDLIEEKINALPQKVHDAIESIGVEEKLRALSEKHKLHLDQWVLLENEIMLTLLGLEEPENMVRNIAKEVGIEEDLAQNLVNDIAVEIFKPIRELMKEEEEEPEDEPDKTYPSDTTAYKQGESSTERKEIQEDPYRESI